MMASAPPVSENDDKELLTWGQLHAEPEWVAGTICNANAGHTSHHEGGNQEKDFSDGEDEEVSSSDSVPLLRLREYQKELAEKALQGYNAIICAPTGSGKTRVGIHIIREHLKKEDGHPKKVAFLARTIPLVMQQHNSLKKYLPSYEVTYITGQSACSRSLHVLLPKYDVIAMTPMILVNHIKTKHLPDLSEFSMIVFDECHHTRKEEPYSILMFEYLKTKTQGKDLRLPQIIGLTASIGIEKANEVEDAVESILQVCGNLDVCHLSTVSKNIEELHQVVPVPAEESHKLEELPEDDFICKMLSIMEVLEANIDEHIRGIQEITISGINVEEVPKKPVIDPDDYGLDYGDPELEDLVFRANRLVKVAPKRPLSKKSQEYGHWVKNVMKNAKRVPIHDGAREIGIREHVRSVIIIAEYLVEYNIALQAYDLVELREVLRYLDKRFREFETIQGHTSDEVELFKYLEELQAFVVRPRENPNLKKLASILMEHLVKKGEKTRGIIFVRTRALTEALVSWLDRCDNKELSDLRACNFTGSSKGEDKGGMTQAQQEATIELFRSGKSRLLIATSVAEEGLDIPECNLVIQYNYAGNEVTTVQTRGRCRAQGGICVLLAMGDIPDKETINRKKVEWMERAIKYIRTMEQFEPAEFESRIKKCQAKTIEDGLIVEKRQKTSLKEAQFSMVCSKCRQVQIASHNLRTIYEKHRISIDRDFLDEIEFSPFNKFEQIDELLIVGKVFCKGTTRRGGKCNNKLGSLFSHRKMAFVALRVESFSFFPGHGQRLGTYKKWKLVPYVISELSDEDIDSIYTAKMTRIQHNGPGKTLTFVDDMVTNIHETMQTIPQWSDEFSSQDNLQKSKMIKQMGGKETDGAQLFLQLVRQPVQASQDDDQFGGWDCPMRRAPNPETDSLTIMLDQLKTAPSLGSNVSDFEPPRSEGSVTKAMEMSDASSESSRAATAEQET